MWPPSCAREAPSGPPMPAPETPGAVRPSLPTAPAVLVTRPAAEAAAWVADLRQRGVAAEMLPLIEIAPAPDLAPAQACWAALPTYGAIMFVSGNAVAYFFAARPAVGSAALPAALRFMAPGPGTARRLLAAGVPAEQIDTPPAEAAQFDSQALWAEVGQRPWAGQRVLIVRGRSAGASDEEAFGPGRDWLARRWTDSGATVDFVTVYERRAPRLNVALEERIQRSQRDGSVWLFSSSEALGHLPPQPPAAWAQARAIATHPRIAQAARQAGWGVVIESRPALADIVASIESLLS